ncbi:MAG: response regulator [Candidatus Omnitrophica bacterium]|nr:response regulator [Candidatus Omnitrophota bacterium]
MIPLPEKRSRKPSLVIIDDEEAIVIELVEFFRDEGFEVYAATNGENGLKIIQEVRPSVCLLDLNLPDMSGLRILKITKDTYPGTKVIVNTGYVDQNLIDQANELKCDLFLHKPFDLAGLKQKVDELAA